MEAACRNVTEEPSEANLVRLLDLWSADWKHRGAPEPWGLEPTKGTQRWGFSGTAGWSGCLGCLCSCERLSQELLSERPPDVHRPPHGPAPRHSEYARALKSCACSRRQHRRAGVDRRRRGGFRGLAGRQKRGRELRGRWLDMHDKPVSFDARRYHMVEPHESSMWALAAYVPQAYARATEQHREALEEAGFPLPAVTDSVGHCSSAWSA